MLRRHIMLRRLKADVLGQIPPLQRSRVSVLPDPVNLKVIPSSPQHPMKLLRHRSIDKRCCLCLGTEPLPQQNLAA